MFEFIADPGDTLNVVWKIRFKTQFLTQLTYMIMNRFSRIEITILFPNQIGNQFVSKNTFGIHNAVKEDFAPKTFTKQEVGLKTKSSYREIPIPDYVFEAILKERQVYERNRNRRKGEFQDMDYICCSNYGKARSKGFHCRYYKQLLAENGLPDIRWHDLRSTYCTLLLKETFNPKGGIKTYGTCQGTHNYGRLRR